MEYLLYDSLNNYFIDIYGLQMNKFNSNIDKHSEYQIISIPYSFIVLFVYYVIRGRMGVYSGAIPNRYLTSHLLFISYY